MADMGGPMASKHHNNHDDYRVVRADGEGEVGVRESRNGACKKSCMSATTLF